MKKGPGKCQKCHREYDQKQLEFTPEETKEGSKVDKKKEKESKNNI